MLSWAKKMSVDTTLLTKIETKNPRRRCETYSCNWKWMIKTIPKLSQWTYVHPKCNLSRVATIFKRKFGRMVTSLIVHLTQINMTISSILFLYMTSQNSLFCLLTQFWESMCILMWWMLLRHTTSDMWHELSALFTLGITTNEVLAEFNRHHSLHHTPIVAKDKHIRSKWHIK